MESFTYCHPRGLNLKKLKKTGRFDPRYSIDIETGETVTCLFLDTFESELKQSGLVLLQAEELLIAMDMKTGRLGEQKVKKDWSFVAELDGGPVSLLLEGVSPLRALLPVATVKMKKTGAILLDDERKTRARFINLTIENGQKSVSVGTILALRGYDGAHKVLKKWIVGLGAIACNSAVEIYTSLGIPLNQYNAKPRLQLEVRGSIKKNTTRIISTFLQVARANEKGVIAALDTEFLHDFRVSLRKIRSVLSLFKGVYGADDNDRLKREFSELMQQTNRLRDLDVYLLNKDEYYALVPAVTHGGLKMLFSGFEKERTGEQKKITSLMQSREYRQQLNTLQVLFKNEDNIQSGPRSKEQTRGFACRIILKRYRNVCKIARSIDETTEDEIIHQLRIHCKKLRYLMEFFAPLFPVGDIKLLIKSLKRLQDNLGRFNDYSVQQVFLKDVLVDQEAVGMKGIQVAESIGALTAMLYQLQCKERMQVMQNFVRFDGAGVRDIFDKLFRCEVIANENSGLLQ